MKTVVGIYQDISEARAVVEDLVNTGINRDNISLVARDTERRYGTTLEGRLEGMDDDTGDAAVEGAVAGGVIGGLAGVLLGLGVFAIPGLGPVVAAGPIVAGLIGAGAGAITGSLLGALVEWGVPEEEAEYYAEGVRRGATLVAVKTFDDQVDNVIDVMERHNPIDIEQQASTWRQEGWTGYDPDAEPYDTEQIRQQRERYRNSTYGTDTTLETTSRDMSDVDTEEESIASIPVVEEELAVGKHAIDRGGVRVHTHVTSEPVEETVNLRQEHVDVQRRPVDRPASEADFATTEGIFEVTERAEEAVVDKQARVVEEVVVRKDVDERTETVHDTVRHTHVDVDRLDEADFDTYRDRYQTHYETSYASTGVTYDEYEPAYRYGYNLARNPENRDREWNELEPAARNEWAEQSSGLWEDFKDAVREGWEEAREALDVDDDDDYSLYAPQFHTHYQSNYAASGYPYNQYEPAYRYGYGLARNPLYRGRDWSEIEPVAQNQWRADQGVWEDFKDAVRHAWESTKDLFDEDTDNIQTTRRNY